MLLPVLLPVDLGGGDGLPVDVHLLVVVVPAAGRGSSQSNIHLLLVILVLRDRFLALLCVSLAVQLSPQSILL